MSPLPSLLPARTLPAPPPSPAHRPPPSRAALNCAVTEAPPRKASISLTKPRPLPPAPIPPPPCSPPPLGRAELRRPWGPRNSLPPSEGAGRGVPRGPHSFLRIAATLRIAGRATRGMPRAPDPGAKNESARRGRSCGPMGRRGRRRACLRAFLRPLKPTRARSRGTKVWRMGILGSPSQTTRKRARQCRPTFASRFELGLRHGRAAAPEA